MTRELRKYIWTEKRKGYPRSAIEKALLELGYNHKEIDDTYEEIRKETLGMTIGSGVVVFILIILFIANFSEIRIFYEEKILGIEKLRITEDSFSKNQASIAENAILKSDATACKNTGVLSVYCNAVITKDNNACRRIEGSIGEYCTFKIAVDTKNPSLCDQTGDLSHNCYLFIALQSKDANLCEKLESDKEYCLSKVSSIKFKAKL